MSQESIARFRVPPVRRDSHRTLQDRLMVRFPRSTRLIRSRVSRLPPGSRLRRELLGRVVRESMEAFNRRDYAVFLAPFDPQVEFHVIGQIVGLESEGVYRGLGGVRKYLAVAEDVWESIGMEAAEVIDFGERYLILAHLLGSGLGSGVDVEHEVGYLMTISGGMVVRVDQYWSHAEALEAVGLSG